MNAETESVRVSIRNTVLCSRFIIAILLLAATAQRLAQSVGAAKDEPPVIVRAQGFGESVLLYSENTSQPLSIYDFASGTSLPIDGCHGPIFDIAVTSLDSRALFIQRDNSKTSIVEYQDNTVASRGTWTHDNVVFAGQKHIAGFRTLSPRSGMERRVCDFYHLSETGLEFDHQYVGDYRQKSIVRLLTISPSLIVMIWELDKKDTAEHVIYDVAKRRIVASSIRPLMNISRACVTRDGSFYALTDGDSIELIEASSGRVMSKVELPPDVTRGFLSLGLGISDDGRFIAYGCNKLLLIDRSEIEERVFVVDDLNSDLVEAQEQALKNPLENSKDVFEGYRERVQWGVAGIEFKKESTEFRVFMASAKVQAWDATSRERLPVDASSTKRG